MKRQLDAHLGQLGRGAARHLGDLQLRKLVLQLLQLLEELLLALAAQFVCLNLAWSSNRWSATKRERKLRETEGETKRAASARA